MPSERGDNVEEYMREMRDAIREASGHEFTK